MGLFVNGQVFEARHGFSLKDYLYERDQVADDLRGIARHIKEIVKDTGIARTTGGGARITGG